MRADPTSDTCSTCGEPYELSNMPTGSPRSATCGSCGDPIIWITNAKSGNAGPYNTKRVVVTTAKGETVSGFVSHFATCPHANRHRKRATG